MARLVLLSLLVCRFFTLVSSQGATSTGTTAATTSKPPSTAPPPTPTKQPSGPRGTGVSSPRYGNSTTKSSTRTRSSGTYATMTAPDVLLRVPTLSVGRIELIVDNLKADVNLNAKVANLVNINAGVALSIRKVNLTIADVGAEVELIVRLGHLADIVNRVFQSLDLNPLLITAINEVTDLVDTVVGAVDGLLGSITHGGTTLSFLIDNLGNIVQQVLGGAGNTVSTIVGDYQTNMTFTGDQKNLPNGLTQKTYSYGPLGSLVNIVFNTLGQVVQASVVKKGAGGASSTGGSGGSSSSGSGSGNTQSSTRGATPTPTQGPTARR